MGSIPHSALMGYLRTLVHSYALPPLGSGLCASALLAPPPLVPLSSVPRPPPLVPLSLLPLWLNLTYLATVSPPSGRTQALLGTLGDRSTELTTKS